MESFHRSDTGRLSVALIAQSSQVRSRTSSLQGCVTTHSFPSPGTAPSPVRRTRSGAAASLTEELRPVESCIMDTGHRRTKPLPSGGITDADADHVVRSLGSVGDHATARCRS